MQDVSRPRPPVEEAGVGVPADFEAALVALLPAAYGYAYRLTRNRADAEDLMQEAALRACRGAQTFEPGTHFKAWFFRIILRNFWERHRVASRRPQTVEIEDAPDLYLYQQFTRTGASIEGDDPMGDLLDRIGTERVAAAIAQLPEEYANVATLYFMEDFAYNEIAHVLDVPLGTVRSRIHRARKMLQKSLWEIAVDAGLIDAERKEET
jgi:RNA polymerase sigma-70 factor (ECF subfamily)